MRQHERREYVTAKQGLFVGLTTLDLIYQVETLPERNQKLVASNYLAAAGGPATNAAVAFGYLGNSARLLSVVGAHPMNQLVLTDLQRQGVAIADLDPTHAEPVPTSSILVTQATGDRAVVSINAVKSQVGSDRIPPEILRDVAVVLIDGHQMAVGWAIAQQAKAQQIPIVVDGGSWKAGFEQVLPLADYVIASANFHPPGCITPDDVGVYLQHLGIPQIAITNGHAAIDFWHQGRPGQMPVPPITPVDTLGAGDIFHGAFCHAILQTDFEQALTQAAAIASYSCQFFGTRSWMEQR